MYLKDVEDYKFFVLIEKGQAVLLKKLRKESNITACRKVSIADGCPVLMGAATVLSEAYDNMKVFLYAGQ